MGKGRLKDRIPPENKLSGRQKTEKISNTYIGNFQQVSHPLAEISPSDDSIDCIRPFHDSLSLGFETSLTPLAAHIGISALCFLQRGEDGLGGGV